MRVAAHVRANATADGVIVLDIASGRVFSANAIGAHIWRRLADGWTEMDVAREIARESGADEAVVRQDVAAFVAQLTGHGFLLMEGHTS